MMRCWRCYRRRWSLVDPVSSVFQAACLIQWWWRGHRDRQRFRHMRASSVIIQRSWRDHYLRRQRAAICIQASWRCYVQRKLYQHHRKHLITLQAACRGYVARRRLRLLKQEKPNDFRREPSLVDHEHGTSGIPPLTPDSDISHWDDFSEQTQSEIPSPASEHSEKCMSSEVRIRERPKSLENAKQRKVVRAKRESRRMRELEQAQFSLELLKVRSGGVSPSEERRWSAEISLDKHPDTPESEGSLGSLEHIGCEENQLPLEEPGADPLSNNTSSPTHRLVDTINETSRNLLTNDLPDHRVTDTFSGTSHNLLTNDLPDLTYSQSLDPSISPSMRSSHPQMYDHQSMTSNDPMSPSHNDPMSPSHNDPMSPSSNEQRTSNQISSPSKRGPLIPHSNGPQNSQALGSPCSQPNGIPCALSNDDLKATREENISSNGPVDFSFQTLPPKSSAAEDLASALQPPFSPPMAFTESPNGPVPQRSPSSSSSAVDIAWGSLSTWRQKSPGLELSESAPAKASIPVPHKSHVREPPLSSSLPTFYIPNQEMSGDKVLSDSVLQRLQKLNREKEELQKQLQQEKQKLMMEQIRQENQELERQRRLKDQTKGQEADHALPKKDQTKGLEADHALPSKDHPKGREPVYALLKKDQKKGQEANHALPKKDQTKGQEAEYALPKNKPSDRPQSLLLQGPQWKSHPIRTEIKGLTVKGNAGGHHDRPVSMFLEQRDRQTSKGDAAGNAGSNGKRPWLHGTANSSIFFTPKGSLSSDSDNSCVQPHRTTRSDPRRLDATEPSGVSEAPHRRKARMARTRSDFMTRGGAESAEDSDDQGEPHPSSPPNEAAGRQVAACHSDSEMMLQKADVAERSWNLQKAISQGEMSRLLQSHRATDPDPRPQRGKIRFWGKMKAAEKLTPQSEVLEAEPLGREAEPLGREASHFTDLEAGLWLVPRSPDLSRGREKENKDPSPKVQRRRSLKISSLEPAQWQNERADIIANASDLKCMDDFLQKKISDLDSEDGKKDSLVDVLFKKSLKEFRQNIFSLYSTSLTGEDGKSFRYRDLGALFEQILEKTMKQHQPRSWSESPVKVWINTFKVFLDEFVTEYKPLNYPPGKIQKTERKKRRKKESDIVEEHNGHIFKATQYNIPTYCEYCSSLIWIMDRAAVCKY
ncbi:unconventional myosin-IXa-like [Mantella aurantiaca]